VKAASRWWKSSGGQLPRQGHLRKRADPQSDRGPRPDLQLGLATGDEIRIAFAGIIDLDGDGLDNNDEFLRLLERQGVIVDEYLKLKPLEFVKRDTKGMSLRTKYLVIAPHPRLDSVPIGKRLAAKETDRRHHQDDERHRTSRSLTGRADDRSAQIPHHDRLQIAAQPIPAAIRRLGVSGSGGAPPAAEPAKKDGN